MTKGLRRTLLAPLFGALLLLGAPSATFAAPEEKAPPAKEGDQAKQPDQGAKPKPGQGEQAKPGQGDQAKQPGQGSGGEAGKDPKAGDGAKDPNAGDGAAKDPKAGDGSAKEPKKGGEAAPPKEGKKGDAKDGKDGDDDYTSRYDRHDGHYDHDRYGRHYRHHHRYDTHPRYYRYGYRGPGWYDDCGYYGPDGYQHGWYDSADACSYQYGPQGDSLRANLSGDQVGPQPGAPNAYGMANLFVDLSRGVLCYRLGYDGINRPTAAHVHQGGPGQNGRPVIDLHPEANGDEGCVGADPTALRNLRDHPEAFYLNLHTPEYPDGAMRGQVFQTGRYS